jgi:NADH:ubiquinone oxidoreductase subunit E
VAQTEVPEKANVLEISPEQLSELELILGDFQGKSGMLIQALHAAQNLIGYLPPPVLRIVAKKT